MIAYRRETRAVSAEHPTEGGTGLTDTREVRPTEHLEWPALAAYLREHLAPIDIPGLDRRALAREMQFRQFPGGHSNLTYLVRFGEVELVLRRPPLGPVAPRAHDMAREYAWLRALNDLFPLAPRPYLLCDDPGPIGSVFYVMERRKGFILRHEEPPALLDRHVARRRTSEAFIDGLVTLHAIDVTTGPLASLGKPAGFVERQITGWRDRWHRVQTASVPEMDDVGRWLSANRPPANAPPAVVHGDFKLDNVMFRSDDLTKIVAVLDWEMSALGEPLVDLGMLLACWAPTGPPSHQDALATVTERPGWFTKEEIVARYAKGSGRDVSAIRYFETLALFKLAAIIQQIFYRYLRGQTDDPRFAHFGERVVYLARAAAELAGA